MMRFLILYNKADGDRLLFGQQAISGEKQVSHFFRLFLNRLRPLLNKLDDREIPNSIQTRLVVTIVVTV